jgi:DNA polymerase-3 subunit gamma/tau
MTYLALARRYRPDDFSKILSQSHITKTLANAIKTGRISHAYLFCGPRGTGKTSTARVLAKSLNCKKGPTSTPCGECPNCREIKAGISPDVFEIDAASNRGIDDIRELRENIRYAPVSSRYKIYIIDEVHRLTPEAFDALLKTLEEPPSHVIFVFATTEPQQLPATILSRTQRFDFKRVPVSALAETVIDVAISEGLDIEPRAAHLLARKADGSLRDALSLLDQLISFAEGKITSRSATEILGLVKADFLFEIASAVFDHNPSTVLDLFNIYFEEGGDIDELASELALFISKLLMIKNGVKDTSLLEMDTMELEKAGKLVDQADTSDLLRMLQIMNDFIVAKKSGVNIVVAMEITLTRLAALDKTVEIEQLLAGLGNPHKISNSGGRTIQQKPGAAGFNNVNSRAGSPPPVYQNNNAQNYAAKPARRPAVVHKVAEIEKWWSDFLEFVKDNKKVIWCQLQHAIPESADNKTVRLGYTDENNHVKRFLDTEKRSITDLLSEYFGNDLAVNIVKTSGDNQAGARNAMPGGSEDFLQRHPKIKQLFDSVDGEIIDFRRSQS